MADWVARSFPSGPGRTRPRYSGIAVKVDLVFTSRLMGLCPLSILRERRRLSAHRQMRDRTAYSVAH